MNLSFPLVLPDFRNLGVIFRCFVLAEGQALLVALANTSGPLSALESFSNGGAMREPILLTCIGLLAALSPHFAKASYSRGVALVLALVFLVGLAGHVTYYTLLPIDPWGNALHTGLLAMLSAGGVLLYFNWRQRALSPNLAEARLTALQARIRPHFLFNSLNTVLSLIRSNPKRAEAVLENLADLFRALLSDPRTLVPLERELELARAYAEVESLRLGNRLRVEWHCEQAPVLAQVPQLILQPLIENAVIHGIEPSTQGGKINVGIFEKSNYLVMVVRNPLFNPMPLQTQPQSPSLSPPREGNHMALANIRERLDLHYDAEARMSHYSAGGEFVVQIEIPLSVTSASRKH